MSTFSEKATARILEELNRNIEKAEVKIRKMQKIPEKIPSFPIRRSVTIIKSAT